MMAPMIAIDRHRMATDGEGVTTLVAFHGCPLRCRYCINPQCLDSSCPCMSLTAEELYTQVCVDNIYFLATGGGVTFGGGEPLVWSEFIREFCRLANPSWNICVETSLNVEQRHLEEVFPYVNRYFVDIKDMHPDIYKAYTRQDNRRMSENLEWLAGHGATGKVVVRLPLIEGYNTHGQRLESRQMLEDMGFDEFDLFDYITDVGGHKMGK